MDVIEAIQSRRSIRGFKPDPIPKKVLEQIIEACRWAPSPGNMEPWEFAILGGEVMETFRKTMIEKTGTRAPSGLEFEPTLKIPELYDKRRTVYYRDNFDRFVYPAGAENVEEKKRAHFLRGSRLFDAPNAILIYTEKAFLNMPWCIMSIGTIAQTLCLAAVSYGLGTCIQGRLVDYPDMLRGMLGITESKVFICGVVIGYPDLEYKPNNVPRIRIPQDEWAHWYGF